MRHDPVPADFHGQIPGPRGKLIHLKGAPRSRQNVGFDTLILPGQGHLSPFRHTPRQDRYELPGSTGWRGDLILRPAWPAWASSPVRAAVLGGLVSSLNQPGMSGPAGQRDCGSATPPSTDGVASRFILGGACPWPRLLVVCALMFRGRRRAERRTWTSGVPHRVRRSWPCYRRSLCRGRGGRAPRDRRRGPVRPVAPRALPILPLSWRRSSVRWWSRSRRNKVSRLSTFLTSCSSIEPEPTDKSGGKDLPAGPMWIGGWDHRRHGPGRRGGGAGTGGRRCRMLIGASRQDRVCPVGEFALRGGDVPVAGIAGG